MIEPPLPSSVLPWYRRRRFKVAISSVIALLAILSVVAAIATVRWLNSPEKILMDAAGYSVRTPAVYHVQSSAIDGKFTVGLEGYSWSGVVDGTHADVVVRGSNLYVKSPLPEKLYGFFVGTKDGQIPPIAQSIIPTIRDKWVSFNLQSLGQMSHNALVVQCAFEEKSMMASSQQARKQWVDLYLTNRFLKIQQSSEQNEANTYSLLVDDNLRKKFFEGLLNTSFYRSLASCSRDTDVFRGFEDMSSPIDVTVSKKDRRLEKLVIRRDRSNMTTVTVDFASVPPIKEPTDAVRSEQLVVDYLQSINSPQ